MSRSAEERDVVDRDRELGPMSRERWPFVECDP
jgi:hypothetical protein